MKHSLHYLLLFLISTGSLVQAALVWEDTFVINIVDEDVKFRKKVILPVGTTTISSVAQNVTVSLSHDTKVFASESGTSTLVFNAGEGTTIFVNVDQRLTFYPSPINDNNIIIELTGVGQIIFLNGRTIE